MLQNNASWVCYCENKTVKSIESGALYKYDHVTGYLFGIQKLVFQDP